MTIKYCTVSIGRETVRSVKMTVFWDVPPYTDVSEVITASITTAS
jgi:hypothetical protein